MRAFCVEIGWLALAVLLAYWNAFLGDFQFDDYNVIVDNPRIHSWAAWAEGLSLGIRPLLKFSYTLDWTLGLGVAGFHLTNLLIHLANTWLVLRLSEAFLKGQTLFAPSGAPTNLFSFVPLLAALLFAVHPVNIEAVTYLSGRSASLMTLCYLGGLLAYATGRERQDGRLLHLAVPLLFLAALMVKETAVTFPLALLLWELASDTNWKTVWRRQWTSWALLAAGVLFFLFSDSYLEHMERSARFNSLTGNLASQLLGFAWLLRQWLLPLWLNIDPDLPLQRDLSGSLMTGLLFIAVLALIAACRKRRPWIAFALAWMVLQLVPLHLILPRLDIANERQLYLAGWPLFLALAIELRLRLHDKAFRTIAATLLIVLTALTLARNRVYDDEIALWEDTVMKSPDKARVHNNLGYAYRLAGRTGEAQREFERAVQLDPSHFRARYNLEYLDFPP